MPVCQITRVHPYPESIPDVAMNTKWLLLFLLLSPAVMFVVAADEDEIEEEAVVDDEGRQFQLSGYTLLYTHKVCFLRATVKLV